ncbi:hypothetical protein CRG98_039781 [Punica granatum]|uniref:Uncharacterized protein n=1 Tax=Punica granatum TaxID=22663 RepID=A0A2I0I770_PUNGR|nr:hypothetical protein CRG98_039781 [Punica granatum]
MWGAGLGRSAKLTNDTYRARFGGIPLKPGNPDLSPTPFLIGLSGLDPLTSKRPPQNGPAGIQGPPGSWNKLQTTFRNSTGFPEGRFSGSKRFPVDLRGTFTGNRDHSDPRTPQDIRGTLRKPRSQVPRSSRGDDLRSGTTSQRSHTRQKGHRNEH